MCQRAIDETLNPKKSTILYSLVVLRYRIMVDNKVLNFDVNNSNITENQVVSSKIFNSISEPSNKVQALVA